MRALLDRDIASIDWLKDVDTITTPPADTNVLQWSAANNAWVPVTGPGGGSGELNTASNLNTGGGVGVFDSKVGVDLKFRGVNVGSSNLTVSFNGATGEIELDLAALSIDYLSDVDTTTSAPILDDLLKFDGSNFVPVAASSLSGATVLDDLTDVDTTTATPKIGDSLIFDGTNWVPDLSQLIKEVDFVGDVIYIGEAQPGITGANPNWRIKEITFVGDDSTTLYADGNVNFDNVWDNRLSLAYS